MYLKVQIIIIVVFTRLYEDIKLLQSAVANVDRLTAKPH